MDSLLPRSIVRVNPSSGSRYLVVFTDQYDPTQEISFYRPAKYVLKDYGLGLLIIGHSDLVRIFANLGSSARIRELDRLLRHIDIASIVLSRYTGEYWSDLLKFAKLRSTPVRVFMDDNLLEVPDILGGNAAALYNQPTRREAMLTTLAECDCVVASTSALERQLAVYPHRAISHTPIYCSTTVGDVIPHWRPDDLIRIGYMASRWHQHDLDYIADAIDSALTYNPKAHFTVFGFDWQDNPVARKHPGRVESMMPSAASYMAFRQKLNSLNWDIGLAPLRPIAYNQCKANTKWVEYTCAGIATIVANFYPYEGIPPSATAFCETDDVEAWAESLDRLINDEDMRIAMRNEAQQLARTTYSIYEHAQQSMQIFNS